jgi:superfamily II DNA or RNA helicase
MYRLALASLSPGHDNVNAVMKDPLLPFPESDEIEDIEHGEDIQDIEDIQDSEGIEDSEDSEDVEEPEDLGANAPASARPHSSARSLVAHILERSPNLMEYARVIVRSNPTDDQTLLLATMAALVAEKPDQALVYHKRFIKHYVPDAASHLLHAIALAQKKNWFHAARILKNHRPVFVGYYAYVMPGGEAMLPWIKTWLRTIDRESRRAERSAREPRKKPAQIPHARARAAAQPRKPAAAQAGPVAIHEGNDLNGIPPLLRLSARIATHFKLPAAKTVITDRKPDEAPAWFQLRSEFAHLSLLQGFDELLCLPLLRNVESYWYQVETVRKVLKQFRGRVLLADEVGLGKTIEAGMVLKEYVMRGMARKVLVLTPASIVGQWLEEMETKFDIRFASTYHNLVRRDPAAFWSQPRVIASIAMARRPEHFEILARQVYDLVIVDEAHHLKNRTTNNWKLVNALQKRFLLLLSATPVQNTLIELYNMLTLLKPGIFKTEKEFRTTYMTPGRPRLPLNRDRMRDLMRDAMIRNTRAQVDVRLPQRTAVTLRAEPTVEEASCYEDLSGLIQEHHEEGSAHRRLALRHLLSAAGSSPAAAAVSIHRFADSNDLSGAWLDLEERYKAVTIGSKEALLLDVLRRNPDEKKIVFVRHKETLNRLDGLLKAHSIDFERFEGSMTGLQKDIAIEMFREEAPVLLSTESGGEGRNLQFANTLINFDLPWNPLALEQRIGRLHRIGQTRQVFIFNLAVRNTLEEYLLQVLDEKINMFELVVGEIGAILGEMEGDKDFAEMVFSAWVGATKQERHLAFDDLGQRVAEARRQYEAVKTLDETLFGDEFVTG